MTRNTQHGWTMWTLLLSLALVAFFALLLMRLVPHYMDNYKLEDALERVAEDPRVASMSRNQIIGKLTNILYIDYGHDIVDLKEALSVEKDQGRVTLSIEYEVVVHLVSNVSALLDFDVRADVSL